MQKLLRYIRIMHKFINNFKLIKSEVHLGQFFKKPLDKQPKPTNS